MKFCAADSCQTCLLKGLICGSTKYKIITVNKRQHRLGIWSNIAQNETHSNRACRLRLLRFHLQEFIAKTLLNCLSFSCQQAGNLPYSAMINFLAAKHLSTVVFLSHVKHNVWEGNNYAQQQKLGRKGMRAILSWLSVCVRDWRGLENHITPFT